VDIASRAPIALAAAMHAIQQGSRMPLDESLLLEQRCFERTMRSKDAAGAMRAYIGRTATIPYQWKGEWRHAAIVGQADDARDPAVPPGRGSRSRGERRRAAVAGRTAARTLEGA